MQELIYLSQNDIVKVRKELLELQDYICPITNINLTLESAVLDHKHRFFKDQELGVDGIGLCRGSIHRQINVFEGKISNSYYRLGLHKLDISLPNILRNLADYLEKGPTNYVHPTEIPKEPKLKKSCYNKLIKVMKDSGYSKKIPEYPKSQKMTVGLKKLFETYSVEIEYY